MYDDTSTGSKDRNSTNNSGGGNIDPLYGQRSALPYTDGADDGDEDSSAALKYLQDVRCVSNKHTPFSITVRHPLTNLI